MVFKINLGCLPIQYSRNQNNEREREKEKHLGLKSTCKAKP